MYCRSSADQALSSVGVQISVRGAQMESACLCLSGFPCKLACTCLFGSLDRVFAASVVLPLSSFERRGELGRGRYGSVFLARLPDSTAVVVKQLHRRAPSSDLSVEAFLLSALSHDRIVRLLGFVRTNGTRVSFAAEV